MSFTVIHCSELEYSPDTMNSNIALKFEQFQQNSVVIRESKCNASISWSLANGIDGWIKGGYGTDFIFIDDFGIKYLMQPL